MKTEYKKGEFRVLAGYKAYTGKAFTEKGARLYNNACENAHLFNYDEASLNDRHLAFCIAAGC